MTSTHICYTMTLFAKESVGNMIFSPVPRDCNRAGLVQSLGTGEKIIVPTSSFANSITVHYSIVPLSTVQCSTVQEPAPQYSTVQYSTVAWNPTSAVARPWHTCGSTWVAGRPSPCCGTWRPASGRTLCPGWWRQSPGGVVQYNTLQFNTRTGYSTVQYRTEQFSSVQYSTVQYCTRSGDSVASSLVLCCSRWDTRSCIGLLYCTVLYCTVPGSLPHVREAWD